MDARSLVIPILVAFLLAVGCTGNRGGSADLVATEVAVQRAAAATLTAEAPAPPEATMPVHTPEPTATVGPMDMPSEAATQIATFQRWTSSQVVNAFVAGGLEAENPRSMTRDDYGLAPMTAVEGTRFLIPSLCQDCGGRILTFSSQQDLELTREFYVEAGKTSALLFSWVFTKDNVLVQINGDLPEDTARQYETALMAMQ